MKKKQQLQEQRINGRKKETKITSEVENISNETKQNRATKTIQLGNVFKSVMSCAIC